MTAVLVAPSTAWAETARALAADLAARAVPDADGAPTWVDPTRVGRRVGEGVLLGRAGIALALAACSRLPGGEPRWASLARRAAAASLRGAASGYPGGPLGWDAGTLGIARAAAVVAELTDDALLREASEQVGALALGELVSGIAALPSIADLRGGVAGVLVGVVAAPLPAELEDLRPAAVPGLVDVLARLSTEDAAGIRWARSGGDPVAGLAQGASGVALALRLGAGVLARQASPVDDLAGARACQLAVGGQRWEDRLDEPLTGGWPDLRAGIGRPGLAWCHGAIGIGVGAALVAASRPRGRSLTVARARYQRALEASRWFRVGANPFEGGVCHGLAGLVEMHLLAACAWPREAGQHLQRARALAQPLAGGHEAVSPTLLTGAAGLALTMARCHDPGIAPSPADPTLGAACAPGLV